MTCHVCVLMVDFEFKSLDYTNILYDVVRDLNPIFSPSDELYFAFALAVYYY